MKNSRRSFIRNSGKIIGGLSLLSFKDAAATFSGFPNDELIPEGENDFWNYIRESYIISSNLINLNNGGVSPQPVVVQEAFEKYNRISNEAPSYFMWRILEPGKENVRKDLALLAGVSDEEIAITRNTSESLETIIFGLTLKKGDEIIVSEYDYPNMMNAWKQREKRDGIILKWIDIPLDANDEQVIKIFSNAISAKTKVVHITHMINWTGRLLPAKQITEIAHKNNCEVILDAAHSFAQVKFSLSDIGCDYAGSSLHKWLCSPFGTGILYVKKEKIAGLYPLFGAEESRADDIRKFEAQGTRSVPAELAIGRAIQFHNMIGSERKEQRLRYLKNYWVNKVKELPGVKFYSPLSDHNSCAITTFGIEGKKPLDIEQFLMKHYRIHTIAIDYKKINGVRVTPHVYTSTSDLDKLAEGIKEFIRQ